MIDRTNSFKRRVLILGSGNRAAKIEELSRGHNHRTITIVGYVRLGEPPAHPIRPTEAGGPSNAAPNIG